MSKPKKTKSYLYITHDGGLALDMAGFLLDPAVQERIERLRVVTRKEIEKNRRAGKSKTEGLKRLRIPAKYRK
ncbi:MAG: hypothetical protein MPK10_09130 [Gammaproteobacteria bacterium]|nr:hypothetical protein [Gammaproteobacteria bacterium]MDA7972709.1 hypothetical protein [Gammaproteobacteria bacterium]MDA8015631.1 hypothetical protein [Gammaproteobacteria bacterium]CAJ2377689.1 MAG: hypothetical protein IBGAMO2_940002 [Arenicellales bacterium IbO2]